MTGSVAPHWSGDQLTLWVFFGVRAVYGPYRRIYAPGRTQGALGATGDLNGRPWVAFRVGGAFLAFAAPAGAADATYGVFEAPYAPRAPVVAVRYGP